MDKTQLCLQLLKVMAVPSQQELKETNIGKLLNKVAKSTDWDLAKEVVAEWRRKCTDRSKSPTHH